MYMQSSIFDISNSSVSFYLDNVLDTQSQTYYKIITLSAMPSGPIANMVVSKSFPPLSEFQTRPLWDHYGSSCKYALLRFPKGDSRGGSSSPQHFMMQQDIPSLLAYLTSHGYNVQTELSKLITDQGLHSHSATSRKFICFASYSPWVLYMDFSYRSIII